MQIFYYKVISVYIYIAIYQHINKKRKHKGYCTVFDNFLCTYTCTFFDHCMFVDGNVMPCFCVGITVLFLCELFCEINIFGQGLGQKTFILDKKNIAISFHF